MIVPCPRHIALSIFTVLILILSFSCQEKVKPLKPSALKLIDTLVAQEWRLLEPVQDSLCQNQKEEFFLKAYDSILQVRMQEKSELIQYEVQ